MINPTARDREKKLCIRKISLATLVDPGDVLNNKINNRSQVIVNTTNITRMTKYYIIQQVTTFYIFIYPCLIHSCTVQYK